jgi:hypothetical protein
MSGGQIATIIVAAMGLFGVLLTNFWNSRSASRNRRREIRQQSLERRQELYLDYAECLSSTIDVFLGEAPESLDVDALLEKTKSLEHKMQVFASNNVLVAVEVYREAVRSTAAQSTQTQDITQAAREAQVTASRIMLAAIRADLEVDLIDSRFRQFRKRRRMRKLLSG